MKRPSLFCLRRPHFFPRRQERVPRFRARVTFGRSPKSDQKRCLKPQVSRLPARLGASGNVTVYHAKIRMALIAAQRIACGPLIAAAPAYGAGGCAGLPFGRLSNRALAAVGGKCRCGPLGRGFFILGEHSTAVWCMGAAAGMGAGAIRCGPFCGAAAIGWKEIQKPSVFGGVLFHISFAVERNMAAGGKKRKISGPLRPKVTRARERGTLPAGDMEET